MDDVLSHARDRSRRAPLQTLQHGFRALEAVARSAGGSLSARELAERLGLRARACYRLLETLCEEGYLTHFEGSRYGIGPRFEELYRIFSESMAPDPRVLDSFVRLRERVDHTVFLNGWYGSEIIVQRVFPGWKFPSWRGEPTIGTGYRDWSTSRSSTKAILAFVSERQLLRYFASRAHPAITKRMITDFEPFRSNLLEVAERGYALDLAESLPDQCGVAASFFLPSRFPLGAFGVAIPAEAFDREREAIVEAVVDAGARASRALGYTERYPPPSPLGQELKPRSV